MGRKRAKRIRVTEEEYKKFKQIQLQCDEADLPITHSKYGWAKTEKAKILPLAKNPEA